MNISLGKWITPEDSPDYLELEFDRDMTGKEEVIVDGFNAKRDFNYRLMIKTLLLMMLNGNINLTGRI